MRLGVAATAAVFAAGVAGCGGDDSPAKPAATAEPAAPPVTVALREEAASGETGTATLRAIDGTSMSVVLELAPAQVHPYYYAHIHKGTCADYRKLKTAAQQEETVADELQDVRAGKSESTVYTASLEQRTTGDFSINVHQPTEGYRVVACGDIPRR